MTRRATPRTDADIAATNGHAPLAPGALPRPTNTQHGLSQRVHAPRSREQVEAQYVAARDAWMAAMRAANSGRPADLAALAIAQEAYEAAVHERELWSHGPRVAIPVESEESHSRDLGAIVGQELAWRRVRSAEKPKGILARLADRFGRR